MQLLLKLTKKVIFSLLLLSLHVYSAPIMEKYPSYEYVFSEFEVDEAYIYDLKFQKFVLNNEKKMSNFYKNSMQRGNSLLPTIRMNLMDEGLSDLFIYISMIESGFSPAIVSPKKAVGLWQFMPETAKYYNLSVGSSFDERCDPVSSTAAAIKYLRKLHKQFGKWYLAVMAYNCGEGRLAKAIKKANSDELSVLINDEAKYLPFETRAYIKKILLVAMIGESTIVSFATKGSFFSADELLQVEVDAGTNLKALAKLIDMPSVRLLDMNRQYKNGQIPKDDKVYTIIIPEEKMIMFYMKYETSEDVKIIKSHLISHYVGLGDTIDSIAKKYNTERKEIKTANHLYDDALTLDTLLVIPVSQSFFEEISQ